MKTITTTLDPRKVAEEAFWAHKHPLADAYSREYCTAHDETPHYAAVFTRPTNVILLRHLIEFAAALDSETLRKYAEGGILPAVEVEL
jgi:hypothetical protein